MSYILTGVQHTTSGDVVIEATEYASKNEYEQRYHHEMDYAMSNNNFIGLGIKVFTKDTLNDVLKDTWVRADGEVITPVAPNTEE